MYYPKTFYCDRCGHNFDCHNSEGCSGRTKKGNICKCPSLVRPLPPIRRPKGPLNHPRSRLPDPKKVADANRKKLITMLMIGNMVMKQGKDS